MGEQIAWIVVFAVIVPILFAVIKLAWDERCRHEDLCGRPSHLEEQTAELNDLLERVSNRR